MKIMTSPIYQKSFFFHQPVIRPPRDFAKLKIIIIKTVFNFFTTQCIKCSTYFQEESTLLVVEGICWITEKRLNNKEEICFFHPTDSGSLFF